ncbi:metallophosphoesterase family protein [Paraburkholderia phenazinium]|uniref:metallophosphoesterase family protein n=1 Tax=Paraburkholderia phenazinium TaxID=60549 RepID=UPI00158CCEF2|nr:metallophosphatase family protein [Paraburkholderia phenazinium]
MKVAQFSDLHYSPANLAEADRCFSFAVGNAIERGAQIGVITGDSTDHRLEAHSPALNALANQTHRLAGAMPVVMLQGTFSHEPPGTLDNFGLMGSTHEVFIADKVQQVAFVGGHFVASSGPVFSPDEVNDLVEARPDIVFTCLPTVNRGQLAAHVGALAAGTQLGDVLAAYLTAAGRVNTVFREGGIATAGLSHGTVSGCETEHGVVMAGLDHEFSLGALFDAQCSAFLLGHIHKSQQWERAGRLIAYPGSIGRFHYGEEGDKGYRLWDVQADEAGSALIPTPSRKMAYVTFDGPPDMAKLEELAAHSGDTFVRVRWQVDEEHRQSVDRAAIEALFSGAAGLKLEGRVLPVMRSRAQGISLETTVAGKLARWCELSDVERDPILDRLQILDTGDAEAIAAGILGRIESAPVVIETLAADDAMTIPRSLPALVPEPAPARAPVMLAKGESLSWLTDDLFAA